MPRKHRPAAPDGEPVLDRFRLQHMTPEEAVANSADGPARVTVNIAESPLAWLASRKDRRGRPLLSAVQFQAGERLRSDFTLAQMTPRMTSNWEGSPSDRRSGGSPAPMTERIVAARKRVHMAMDSAGPEFAGLLLDVCCFLKGLEDVERERQWPPRSAKLVLQLALDCLARHYGLRSELRGRSDSVMRSWSLEDVDPR
jgi:hypothetical protein